MLNIQQTKITEILNNIAMSCRMEGLEMTDEYGQCALLSITAAQLYRIACIRSMRNTFETHLCQ